LYLPANSWCVIRVGYPYLEILTTSKTPQHRSCWETRSSSYWSGNCLAFGFMQRMKWGVVFSSWCISLKSWLYRKKIPLKILQSTNYCKNADKKNMVECHCQKNNYFSQAKDTVFNFQWSIQEHQKSTSKLFKIPEDFCPLHTSKTKKKLYIHQESRDIVVVQNRTSSTLNFVPTLCIEDSNPPDWQDRLADFGNWQPLDDSRWMKSECIGSWFFSRKPLVSYTTWSNSKY
jgi:hypothetical protein